MSRQGAAYITSREILASPEKVFAAFVDPERKERGLWPDGFTNTFNTREFKSSGKRKYVKTKPDSHKYTHDKNWEEVSPTKIVFRHASGPTYRLTIGLKASAKGTLVFWEQVFDSEEFAERMEHILTPANEQNLNRLTKEVLGEKK